MSKLKTFIFVLTDPNNKHNDGRPFGLTVVATHYTAAKLQTQRDIQINPNFKGSEIISAKEI